MANVSRPNGAVPIRSRTGQLRLTSMIVDSGNTRTLGIGDLVKQDSGGFATRCTTGDTPIGIFQGATILDTDGNPKEVNYVPASTAATILVAQDPDMEFVMQAYNGGSSGYQYAFTMNGLNADLYGDIAPSAVGRSNQEINLNTAAVTATLVFRILRIEPKVGNTYGTGIYNTKVILGFNLHQLRTALGV